MCVLYTAAGCTHQPCLMADLCRLHLQEMKTQLLHELVLKGTFSVTHEQPYLIEKIASLVSEVAIREWCVTANYRDACACTNKHHNNQSSERVSKAWETKTRARACAIGCNSLCPPPTPLLFFQISCFIVMSQGRSDGLISWTR